MGIKTALGQVNLVIGNFEENFDNIKNFTEKAIEKEVKLLIFPELTAPVKGAKDLLLIPEYIEKSNEIIKNLLPYSNKISILIGGAEKKENDRYNTVFLLQNGKVRPVARLYSVSHAEKKYFSAQKLNEIFEIDGEKFLAVIGQDTPEKSAVSGTDYVINLNSTPFEKEKTPKCPKYAQGKKTILMNHTGLAQEFVYDGGSSVWTKNSELALTAPFFMNTPAIISDEIFQTPSAQAQISREEAVFNTLSYAFKEFCRVNKFEKAILGLSGGIDSALTAVIMCDAIGAENVLGITMPSRYSTDGSVKDSYDLAENLGMECRTVPIKPLFDTFIEDIQGKLYFDLAEENLQARLRANILMSCSNRENRVLVSTGNKSECAMGYCTLYGDTAGGINLISDLYKTEVYALSRWVNRNREIIPENTITKAPSAELRPDQKDQDSLPDYEVLDDILYRWIEEREPLSAISKTHGAELTKEIINKLNIMEFKRNQLTYSLSISKVSLLDRDFPLVNSYRV